MRWLWILVLVAVVACTPARRKARGDILRDISFDGNGGALSGHNDYELRTQMELEATAFGLQIFPLNFLVDPKLYNTKSLVTDAFRLEVWYAHHGWFDARVVGWRTREVKKSRKRRAGIVDIRGFVEPGAPSLVRGYELVGELGSAETFGRTVLRTGYLKKGRQYSLDFAKLDQASLRRKLQESGYAYADVQLSMEAFPEDLVVDVALLTEPGIPARIGKVTIEGNKQIKTRFIEQNLRISEGAGYRINELKAAQNRLFDMGTFSIVSVTPDLSDPTQPLVPIKVKVSENKFRSIRFGVGAESEGLQTFEPHVSVRFKHTNLLNQLVRLNFFASVGAVAGYSSVTGALTPTWQISGSVIYPRIFGQKVAQQLDISIKRGVEPGLYVYDNPVADFRSVWKPTDQLVLSLGPHIEQYTYRDIEQSVAGPAELQRLFGDNFVNPYRITSVDFSMTLDWRDDPLSTRRGSFLSTNTRLAFPITAQDFTYAAIGGDWRLFRPIRVKGDVPFTWATRIQGRALIPVNGSTLPYPELVFLGGASSHRGFPSKGFGPYETVCRPDAARGYFVPQGGTLGGVFSQEFRYYGAYNMTYALFADLGVLMNPSRASPLDSLGKQFGEGFRAAAGVGARYGSPLGPIRIDIAIRPPAPEDLGPVTPVDCGSQRTQRYLDITHRFSPASTGPGLMVFFAFGEAI